MEHPSETDRRLFGAELSQIIWELRNDTFRVDTSVRKPNWPLFFPAIFLPWLWAMAWMPGGSYHGEPRIQLSLNAAMECFPSAELPFTAAYVRSTIPGRTYEYYYITIDDMMVLWKALKRVRPDIALAAYHFYQEARDGTKI